MLIKVVGCNSVKTLYSLSKEVAACGSKLVYFRVDPFSEDTCCAGKQSRIHSKKNGLITKTCLYNVTPFNPTFIK